MVKYGYPNLMWNSRFAVLSGDPFDSSAGLQFPAPEGMSLSYQPHLLTAQAFIPPTERTEVTGFAFQGDNDAIRAEVMRRLNATPAYRRLFGTAFPTVRAADQQLQGPGQAGQQGLGRKHVRPGSGQLDGGAAALASQ
ncbi:hypothetical protein K2Z83_20855 [Oscillochloris sp. ZM17-4]|uniref:hypothetical protein n=1 Tax=Oscillochloris sp. ZM17-4 TaxID=2866714 RepID=UPI001C72D698|nr:hypothetical protein [Oscillochloris sp. ZM17-4]